MGVVLTLTLFGKPGMELEEGAAVTAQQLRDLGRDLLARLDKAADIVEKLTGAGWEAQMALYHISLVHPYIHSSTQAVQKLLDLGIDPEDVDIDEWEEEDGEELE